MAISGTRRNCTTAAGLPRGRTSSLSLALRSVPERFQHCVPQQYRIVLASTRQLEHSFGDQMHGGSSRLTRPSALKMSSNVVVMDAMSSGEKEPLVKGEGPATRLLNDGCHHC
jgi:hypothetical protein